MYFRRCAVPRDVLGNKILLCQYVLAKDSVFSEMTKNKDAWWRVNFYIYKLPRQTRIYEFFLPFFARESFHYTIWTKGYLATIVHQLGIDHNIGDTDTAKTQRHSCNTSRPSPRMEVISLVPSRPDRWSAAVSVHSATLNFASLFPWMAREKNLHNLLRSNKDYKKQSHDHAPTCQWYCNRENTREKATNGHFSAFKLLAVTQLADNSLQCPPIEQTETTGKYQERFLRQ